MFNSISGTITEKTDHSVCILTGGIEWEASMGQISLSKLPPAGEEFRIYCHLHHKEDSMKLYGFSSRKERSLFLDLLRVNGVGPSLAVKIISGMTVDDLIKALDAGNETVLSKIPGLGKKTAQKIILALRGKISLEEAETGNPSGDDVLNALVEMGFERRKAKDAVQYAAKEIGDTSEGDEYEKELLRKSIQYMSNG